MGRWNNETMQWENNELPSTSMQPSGQWAGGWSDTTFGDGTQYDGSSPGWGSNINGGAGGINTAGLAQNAANVNKSPNFTFTQKAFGGKDQWGNQTGGWVSPTIQGASALMQGYLGFKQLGLAEDQLAFGKQAHNQNYQAMRATTNNRIRDRHAARTAAVGAGAYQKPTLV